MYFEIIECFSSVYNLIFIGYEAIISIFIAFCKRYAYDGFIGKTEMIY
jgi:hypothetical protein